MWKIFKTSENKVLKIESDEGIQSLNPGDFYHLTVRIDSLKENNNGISGSAILTARYQWDGKTLRRVKI